MLNESEIHLINRKICREFVGEMLKYIDMPITLMESSERRQNPDFKEDMVRNQKRLITRFKKMKKELITLETAFTY